MLGYDWLADGIDYREVATLWRLDGLAGRDMALARLVADYPWFADGPDDGENSWLRELGVIGEKDPALAQAAAGYSREAGAFTAHDMSAFLSLANIAARDETLADGVAGYAWVVDGTTEDEAVALSSLAGIAVKDAALAETVAGYSWVADDIAADERWALSRLDKLAAEDLALANIVAIYSWVADDITQDEEWAIGSIANIATKDLELAEIVAAYPWVADDITAIERRALTHLSSVAAEDLALAETVAAYPWIADDITGAEWSALNTIDRLAAGDVALAEIVATYPWVADDITGVEGDGLIALDSLAAEDLALADIVAAYSWIADDITETEWSALHNLGRIATKDLELAEIVAAYPWVADDITETERWALHGLHAVTPDTARQLLEMAQPAEGIGDDSGQWDVRLIAAVGGLGQKLFEELADEPWFADGIDDEEKALLTVVTFMRHDSPNMYSELVQSRHIQSFTVSLPLAGEVDIWVFGNAPFRSGEDLPAIIADTARIAEGLLGVPFPTNEIILVVVTPGETVYQVNAGYYGTFMVLYRSGGGVQSVPHETAHYYFTGRYAPAWLREGGAEFIEAYTRDRLGIESLQDRKPWAQNQAEVECLEQGMKNIRQLNERTRELDHPIPCHYSLGEFFLHNLFEILGEEAFGSALGELYLLSRSERRRVTEEEIYQAFREHTPAKRIRGFRYLYERWHGGSFLDEQD